MLLGAMKERGSTLAGASMGHRMLFERRNVGQIHAPEQRHAAVIDDGSNDHSGRCGLRSASTRRSGVLVGPPHAEPTTDGSQNPIGIRTRRLEPSY
jgi:hypothetical protein